MFSRYLPPSGDVGRALAPEIKATSLVTGSIPSVYHIIHNTKSVPCNMPVAIVNKDEFEKSVRTAKKHKLPIPYMKYDENRQGEKTLLLVSQRLCTS